MKKDTLRFHPGYTDVLQYTLNMLNFPIFTDNLKVEWLQSTLAETNSSYLFSKLVAWKPKNTKTTCSIHGVQFHQLRVVLLC